MKKNFVTYFETRDWRLLVIEVSSWILAILSAILLESEFFKLFIHNDDAASAFAVLVLFCVTFSAHVAADNLQQRPKHLRTIGYWCLVSLLAICYTGVLAALLGMSNYTMAVIKADKDLSKIEKAVVETGATPKIKAAEENLKAFLSKSNNTIARHEGEIAKLDSTETVTGFVYATQKRKYEELIGNESDRQREEQAKFDLLKEKEESRLFAQTKSVTQAGKQEGTIGAYLSNRPAALPMLTLVILFVVRLSFPASLTRVIERTESLEFSSKRTIAEAEKHVPNSNTNSVQTVQEFVNNSNMNNVQAVQIAKPANLKQAVDWYVKKKIGVDNGWSQRRIANEYNDGKLTEVNNMIKLKKAELAKFEEV